MKAICTTVLIVAVLLLVALNFDLSLNTERIILATTTSTENSGLLRILLPPFEEKNNIRIDVISTGTGKALELGRQGNADVLLVHSENDEIEFMNQKFGIRREVLMYNDFVILGPIGDPADVLQADSVVDAFKQIYESGQKFISRGDNSGTHMREKEIWEQTNLTPVGNNYMETGQGMGRCLTIADESQAYILSDRGTYLAFEKEISLKVVFESDPLLKNVYSVIAVNPELNQRDNYDVVGKLIDYLTSQTSQNIIHNYEIGGQTLFYPLRSKDVL